MRECDGRSGRFAERQLEEALELAGATEVVQLPPGHGLVEHRVEGGSRLLNLAREEREMRCRPEGRQA